MKTLLFTAGKRSLSLVWKVSIFLPFVSSPQLALIAHNINLQKETRVSSLASPSI